LKQTGSGLIFNEMRTAFIYANAYLDYDYGPTHHLRIIRLKLTYDLIKAYGLLDLPSVQFIPTIKAEEKDLAVIRSKADRFLILSRSGRSKGRLEAYTNVNHSVI
jgi:acetoin utilization deacetylase AcuC-like enzyme